MKDRLLKLLPYAAVLAAGFYLFPLFIGDTGSGMLVLLLLLPLTVLTLATLYGGLRGWDFLFPATVAILFTPTLFIFYNPSAWVISLPIPRLLFWAISSASAFISQKNNPSLFL